MITYDKALDLVKSKHPDDEIVSSVEDDGFFVFELDNKDNSDIFGMRMDSLVAVNVETGEYIEPYNPF